MMPESEDQPKRRVGRPTKRQKERVDRLVQVLRTGNTRRAACQFAGISETTLADWISNFPDFREMVERAESEAEVRNVAIVQKAAQERDVVTVKVKTVQTAEGPVTITEKTTKREMDWKAAAWWLGRRRPRDWGSTAGVVVGAKGGIDGDPADRDLADLLVDIAVKVSRVPPPAENAEEGAPASLADDEAPL